MGKVCSSYIHFGKKFKNMECKTKWQVEQLDIIKTEKQNNKQTTITRLV